MYNIENFDNDLYFLCSMIEYVGRETNNKRKDIVNKIGFNNLKHEYSCACVNHCLPVEQICSEWIESYNITNGSFNNIENIKDIELPDFWGIGDVYMSLILNTLAYEYTGKDAETNSDPDSLIKQLIEVYNSFITEVMDNYNNLFYTECPMYHYCCYKGKTIL